MEILKQYQVIVYLSGVCGFVILWLSSTGHFTAENRIHNGGYSGRKPKGGTGISK